MILELFSCLGIVPSEKDLEKIVNSGLEIVRAILLIKIDESPSESTVDLFLSCSMDSQGKRSTAGHSLDTLKVRGQQLVTHPLDTLKVRGQQLVIPWIHSR